MRARHRDRLPRVFSLVMCAGVSMTSPAFAGPPFVTDDPEPVPYRNWEVYLASLGSRDERAGWTGTAPHLEVNYGPLAGVQLHTIVPLAYAVPEHGKSAYGPGDVELGVKIRFLEERRWAPMLGTFPLVEVPVGSERRGLGEGTTQIFVPFWLQKSFGDFTTYGGWGVWFEPQEGRHWWFFGWLLQRKVVEHLTLGAELYHETPKELAADGRGNTAFNAGGIVDVTDHHHIMLTCGRSIVGPTQFHILGVSTNLRTDEGVTRVRRRGGRGPRSLRLPPRRRRRSRR